MHLLLSVVLVAFVGGGTSTAINRELAVAFMLQMKKFVRSGCLYIHADLQTDISEEKQAVLMLKDISKSGSMLATSEIAQFPILVQEMGCRNNQPLQVFLRLDSQAITILQQITSTYFFDSKWLILANHKISPNLLNPLPLGLNCYFYVAYPTISEATGIQLVEMFRVGRESSVQDRQIAVWNSEEKLLEFQSSPKELVRRSNLFGYTLKALIQQNQYYTEITTLNNSEIVIKGGYYGLIWKILEENLNFNTQFSISSGQLLYNKTTVDQEMKDAGLLVMRFKPERTLLVKFTTPLKEMQYNIFIRQPSQRSFKWNNFLIPFSSDLWLCCFGTLLLITITAVIVIRMDFRRTTLNYLTQNEDRQLSSSGKAAVTEEFTPPTIYEIFFSILGAFSCQAYELTDKRYLIRCIYLIAYLNAVILTAAYSANFISGLTVNQITLPFDNLKQLVDDNTYDLGVLKISQNIIDPKSDYFSQQIWNLMNRDSRNIPDSILQAYQEMCDRKYAFLTPRYNLIPLVNSGPCHLATLPARETLISAMILPDKTPYHKLFNFRLNRMRETGIFTRLDKDIFPNWLEQEHEQFEAVGFINMLPTLSILLIGWMLAYLLLVIEYIYNKRYRCINRFNKYTNQNQIEENTEEEQTENYLKLSELDSDLKH